MNGLTIAIIVIIILIFLFLLFGMSSNTTPTVVVTPPVTMKPATQIPASQPPSQMMMGQGMASQMPASQAHQVITHPGVNKQEQKGFVIQRVPAGAKQPKIPAKVMEVDTLDSGAASSGTFDDDTFDTQ